MKFVTLSALMLSAVTMAALPAVAGTCSTGCRQESKKPVTGKKGQFEYAFVCIDDGSGDEVRPKVTAANDKAAQTLAVKKC